MSILINSYKSSWILRQTNCAGNIIIPAGGGGKLIAYQQNTGSYLYSINYGSSPTTTFTSALSGISIRGNSNENIMEYTAVRNNIGSSGDKQWANYVRNLNTGSNSRYLSKYYSGGSPPDSSYFSTCASNSDPFSSYDPMDIMAPVSFKIYSFTSGLNIGGYQGVGGAWVDVDSISSVIPNYAQKIKYYYKESGGIGYLVGYYILNDQITFLNSSLETNTYLFGESDGTLNSTDYNTDCSQGTNPYTKNNLYLAKGTAKIVCCSENNEYQLVYFYQNSTYGTGVVLFKNRNFVKKLNQFQSVNSLAMSYDGQVQAISGSNKLYVSRNYGY